MKINSKDRLNIAKIFILFYGFVIYSGVLKPQKGYTFFANPMFWGILIYTAICILYILQRSHSFRVMKQSYTPILYMLPFVFSIWLSFWVNGMLLNKSINEYGLQKAIYFTFLTLPLCIILPIIADEIEDIRYYFYGLFGLGVIVSGILLYTFDYNVMGSGRYQVSGELIGVGTIVLFVMLVSSRASLIKRLLYICIILFMVIAIAITAARGAIIGLGLVILLIFFRSSHLTMGYKFFLAFCLLIGLIAFFKYDILPSNIIEHRLIRRFSLSLSKYSPEGGRYIHINRALGIFINNPILGIGPGNYATGIGEESGYPHNIIMESLCEFGIVGFITLLYVFINGYFGIWKAVKENPYSTLYNTTFYLWIFLFLISMKSGDINSNRYFWIINALCIYFSQKNKLKYE